MSSLNETLLIGYLGKDPAVKSTGNTFATIRLAINESWKDKSGKKQTRIDWIDVLLNGHHAKFAISYLSKGCKVLVKGKLRENKWIDEKGHVHSTIQVQAQKIEHLGSAEIKADEKMQKEKINSIEDANFI
jgi:single-strand DNA-binding protein